MCVCVWWCVCVCGGGGGGGVVQRLHTIRKVITNSAPPCNQKGNHLLPDYLLCLERRRQLRPAAGHRRRGGKVQFSSVIYPPVAAGMSWK